MDKISKEELIEMCIDKCCDFLLQQYLASQLILDGISAPDASLGAIMLSDSMLYAIEDDHQELGSQQVKAVLLETESNRKVH